MKLFDSHNHLQDDRLKGFRDKELNTFLKQTPTYMVVNGTTPADWPTVTSLAKKHANIFPSYGLHPWKNHCKPDQWLNQLHETLFNSSYKAIGECGLDRWIRPSKEQFEDQISSFLEQLNIAHEKNLPITVHCLKATGAFLEILKKHPLPDRGLLLHSFSLNPESLRELLQYNIHFSISPYFFIERKSKVLEVFKKIPQNRLMLETDAPDMIGPNHFFHKTNTPDKNNPPSSISKLYEISESFFECNQTSFFENSWNYFAT